MINFAKHEWVKREAGCLSCGNAWTAIFPATANQSALQCPRCKAVASFTKGPPVFLSDQEVDKIKATYEELDATTKQEPAEPEGDEEDDDDDLV